MFASHYAHGLPDDPVMAGFAAALDPFEFGLHFGEAIEPADLELNSCTLDRFRYRRGERLVVVYRVEATNRLTGCTRSMIVAGRIHADRSPSLRSVKAATDHDLSRIASLPALGMRIEIFPRDRRLPGLSAYVDELSSPRVSRLVHAATGWLPGHGDEIAVDPVRYRPGIAATLRYRSRSQGPLSASRQCFVKLSSQEGVIAPPCPAAIFNRAVEGDNQSIRLSAPVFREPEAGVAAYAAAPGCSLRQIVRNQIRFKPLVQAAGEALARFHMARVPELPTANCEQEQRKYERTSRLLAWACPKAQPALQRIEAAAPAVWRGAVLGPTHGDMKPDHLFISSESQAVHLIDNDALAIGNPLLDIGSMLTRLDAMHWLDGADEQRARAINETFSDAYFGTVPASWSRHLGEVRALSTLLICQHAVQRLVPGWQARVLAELEKAAANV